MKIQARGGFAYSSRVIQTLLVPLMVLAARGDTFVTATGTNTTLGTAQAMNVTPDLVIHQIPPNFTLGTAQPVSPQYMASDALGSITGSHTQEFFSFQANAGDHLHLTASTASPATQFPELLLYDNNGNLVAIANGNAADASSDIIDFTVPSGGSGTWSAEIVGSPSAPNPATNFFNYNLRLSGTAITYSTDVLGALTNPNDPGFYTFGANVGDTLHLEASAANPATQFPELLLYDNNGNLVAIANGNAADASSDIIDFTIPSGDAGNWTAEVAGSPSVANPNTDLFHYDLTIQGDTGTGPINPIPSTVPEPSTVALLGLSIALAGLISRRRNADRR
jgi:hypothetical protein